MDDNERNAPATKGDIAAVKGDIAVIRGDIADLLEALRGVETKLLSAFYAYAKTNDKRVLEAEANESVLRSRMATLEARVLDLEEKGNTPPVA